MDVDLAIDARTLIDPSRSGLNSVQGQIDERRARFTYTHLAQKSVAMSSIPTFQHLLGYFHIDVGAEMGSEPRTTPVVVTLNQLERVPSREGGDGGTRVMGGELDFLAVEC